MISLERYNFIKRQYGHCGSWAVWANEDKNPKDNVGDLSVLDTTINPKILNQVNPDIVLVALNISRKIKKPLANFHDPKPTANDYKIRYAFRNTPFEGAYMTDIIKDYEQISSGKMMTYVKQNPAFEQKNIKSFREELLAIGSTNPTIVAFGRDTHKILRRNLRDEFEILKATHFSHFMNKENYREEILQMKV